MTLNKIATRLSLGILTISLTGCAIDVGKTIAEIRKPTVTFAHPASWRCDAESAQIPTTKGLEKCTMCLNVAKLQQDVTIEGLGQTVPGGGQVAICQTTALVIAP